MDEPLSKTKVAIVGRGGKTSRLAAAIAMSTSLAMPYFPQGHMPFEPPYSRQPLEPLVVIKTSRDCERLQKAEEKRKRKRLKQLRDMAS